MDLGIGCILLATEDPQFEATVRRVLADFIGEHTRIERVSEFQEALDALLTNAHEMAFLHGPFANGRAAELVSTARHLGCREPIIILSHSSALSSDVEALRAGASDYLHYDTASPGDYERAIRHALSRRKIEHDLRERLRIDKLITAMSMRFINIAPSELERQIDGALKLLGEAVQTHRASLFLRDIPAGTVSVVHEWCAPGIASARDRYQRLPFENFAWLADQLVSAGSVVASSLKDIPKEAGFFNQWIAQNSIGAFVVAPLLSRGILMGAVAFTLIKEHREWPRDTVRLLRIAAEILGNAIEQRRVQKALSDSERRYRTVVEGLGEGIILCDADDIVLQVNSRMAEITGYRPEEMLGRHSYDLLSPSGEEHLLRNRTLRRLQGISEQYEIHLRRKDGSLFWASINATPVQDELGRFVATLGAITDVSERKIAVEELHRQREFLRLIIDSDPNMIFVRDSQFRFTLVNKAFASFYGLSPSAIEGKTDAEVHPDAEEAQRYVAECRKVLETGKPLVIQERAVRAPGNGDERWHYTIRKPITLPDSADRQVLSVAIDITERKRAEAEAIRLQRQLLQSQKLEAIGQLAAGVAHDLNNALGAVVGHLQLLQINEGANESVRSSVDIALSGCERALSLIEQLLGFSRQGKYDPSTFALGKLVRETVSFLSKVIEKDLTIMFEGDADTLFIHADAGQVQQVLTNLIINAKQAMPSGGAITFSFGTRTVTEDPRSLNATAKAGEYVSLAVTDTGVGIAPELLDKIFEPFFTTKQGKEGSGLGLAMVYGIMQSHGGWVEVESKVAQGSTFRLLFPRVREEHMTTRNENMTELQHGSGTVLVIDDEAILVDLTKKFLEMAGISSVGFTSGAEALTWYENHWREVDLVILDMKMAKMDGKACFDALKQINSGVRIAILSGYVQDAAAQDLLNRGALRFFQKPLKYPELVTWVATVLGKSA